MALLLEGLPMAASTAEIGLGASASMWESFGLPLDLTFAGGPGCSVVSALEVPVAIPAAGGRAVWSTPLPADPALTGAAFYAEALVADAVNPLGLVFSNAVCAVVGAK